MCMRAREDGQVKLAATHQAAAGGVDAVVEVVSAGGGDGLAIPCVGQGGLANPYIEYAGGHRPLHLEVEQGDAVVGEEVDGVGEFVAGG